MKSAPFSHLHCHTDHSMLDGVGRAEEYAELAARAGHSRLACTDHGSLSGLPALRRACAAHGRNIKPVNGIELYVADDREVARQAKKTVRGGGDAAKAAVDPTFLDAHLVLLAQSQAGWSNLLAINDDAVRHGFYYHPRATTQFVLDHADGLVCTTACLGSHFGRLALRGDETRLRALMGKYKAAFGGRFFAEWHFSELPDQKRVNTVLARAARHCGVRVLLASDVHYACRGDAARQDEIIAVARHTPVDDPKAFKLSARELWFCDPGHLVLAARRWGYDQSEKEILAAAAVAHEVAESCDSDIYPDAVMRPPEYVLDDGTRPADPYHALKIMALRGFRDKIDRTPLREKRALYLDRLQRELGVVRRCGMVDFFLVAADVAAFCRSRSIGYWTRGSGVGSLLAALVGITPIDPLRFGLLFERFVDPSRPNAPDFDVDIDAVRRPEVVAWLYEKYGGKDGERIARVGSVQTFGMRSAIRDVCKARGVDPGEAEALAAAVELLEPAPGAVGPRVEQSLSECGVAGRQEAVDAAVGELKAVARGRGLALLEARPDVVRAACEAVGRAVRITRHAAGFVVAPGPLREYMPVWSVADPDAKKSESKRIVVTAWSEGQASQDITPTGILKLDLLSLDTISAVRECARLASLDAGRDVLADLDPWKMDFADPKVMAEFASGVGFGLHQLQSTDQQLAQMLRRMRPKSVDDVVAAVALYRPGAMKFMDDFIDRASGRAAVPSLHPIYDEETSGTYGIMVYQEQVMKVLHRLGGMPLRDVYQLTKAISKKKEKEIKAAREKVVDHAVNRHGMERTVADDFFTVVEGFAGYSFNHCVDGETVLSLAGSGRFGGAFTTVGRAFAAWNSRTPLGKKMRAGRWRVLQMDSDGRIRPGVVKAIYENGVRPVLEIRTVSGRSIRVTSNHRLLTSAGYVEAGALRVGGDLICDRGRSTEPDLIASIAPAGSARVYDLEMATAGHNFLANGIVSHNSHAASYGVLSFVTAYLRANYPMRFWQAWLNFTPNEGGKKKKGGRDDRKIELMMRQAAAAGVKLLPPLLGRSGSKWEVTRTGALLAPLSMIIGVGEKVADGLREAWRAERWGSLRDFLEWAEKHKAMANSKVVAALAASGAMRAIGATTERAVDLASAWSRFTASKARGTQIAQAESLPPSEVYVTVDDAETRMELERRALGFAFWTSPWKINGRAAAIARLLDAGVILPDQERATLGRRRAFLVTSVRPITDKNGRRMAFVQMSGAGGEKVRAVCFSRVWEAEAPRVRPDRVYLVRGGYDRDGAYIPSGPKAFLDLDSATERANTYEGSAA